MDSWDNDTWADNTWADYTWSDVVSAVIEYIVTIRRRRR